MKTRQMKTRHSKNRTIIGSAMLLAALSSLALTGCGQKAEEEVPAAQVKSSRLKDIQNDPTIPAAKKAELLKREQGTDSAPPK